MRDANSYRNAAFFPAFWFSAASPLILLHDWRKVYRSLWAAVAAAYNKTTSRGSAGRTVKFSANRRVIFPAVRCGCSAPTKRRLRTGTDRVE